MAKRIQRESLVARFAIAAILCGACGSAANADTTLVKYDFDYDVLNSGPDTYQVFQHKSAKAEISTAYASGGYASAHLTDQAHDGDFVEFQGYFPEQTSGVIRFRFKFLIADQRSLFNIALVGKERYKLSALGIAFWLIYEDGWLKHMSDSIPKKLFRPNPYEWLGVDALLDVKKGAYSLRIVHENGEVATQLDNQQFAAGAADAHSLQEYSFIGDLADLQPADFYVDDVSIETSNDTKLPPMVAPGRRKYFYEIWDDYHRQLQGHLRCLPAINLADFGIFSREYAALANRKQLDVLGRLTGVAPHVENLGELETYPELSAIADWIGACNALEKKEIKTARAHIDKALQKEPNAYIYQLTSVLIDATHASDLSALNNRIYGLSGQGNEVRNQIALAMIAFHARENASVDHGRTVVEALKYLNQLTPRDAAQLQSLGLQPMNTDYIAKLRRYMPDTWEPYVQWMLLLEQQYYSDLWQGHYREAYLLATQIAQRLAGLSVAPGIWLERQADSAFLNREIDVALDLYNRQAVHSYSSVLKMSDMYHLQGDLASEKALRETIYKNFSKKP